MTDLASPLADLDGGPHDLEFFFDPGCPFAWQTSVWIRRVAELRDLSIGWRFISLKIANEDKDLPPAMVEAQERTYRYLRVAAEARARLGNAAVDELYRAWGERYWYTTGDGDVLERLGDASARMDVTEILTALDLPADLVEAADSDRWDALLRAETEEAFRRTGRDVGTPIITYGSPDAGHSYFGPVISAIPGDDDALRLYDALRTLAELDGFSELKRSDRAPLDLPLFAQG